MKHSNTPKFGPGTTYRTRGKHPRVCTVKDVHTTYNLAGEIISITYLTCHQIMGQTVTNRDVCETTIAMGLLELKTSNTPQT